VREVLIIAGEASGDLHGAGVAEQLRRIVGPIVEYPNMILNKMLTDNDIKEDLAMIQHSAQKAIEILSNLITLGQMKDFPTEPLNLNALIEELANDPRFQVIRQKAPLVRYQTDLAHHTSPVIGNKQYMMELVGNLVASASSSMADTGQVRVSTENIKINETIMGFEVIEAGEYVVLKINDSGPVMDEEEINRFFEPFAGKGNSGQQSRGGGLGTAVAYAIIKGHKGMIDIKSSGEKGTEIVIYFPVYTGTEKPKQRIERVDVQGVETILVVDDDAELRKATMAYLRSIGYKVAGARNGNEAVEIIQKVAQGQGQPIDLIVLDMIMADDFDGLETYKAILQINPRQKAIMVSGFTITERIKTAMRIGVGQCLLKPYDSEDIANAVRTELDKPDREITDIRR